MSTPAPSRFAAHLRAAPAYDLLCGTHICDLYAARAAIETKTLRASPCDKFIGENLLYIFYGKPSFRPKTIAAGPRFPSYFPVCFVLKLTAPIKWKRIYPFDTGAFPSRYSSFFHPHMPLDDFLMPPETDSARRIVSGFFASNADYYDTQPLDTITAASSIETNAYHTLLRAFGAGQALQGDDRLAAIEMQAETDVFMDTKSVQLIVLPDKAMTLDDVKTALAGCGVPFETYRTGSLSPVECYGLISATVRNENGLK